MSEIDRKATESKSAESKSPEKRIGPSGDLTLYVAAWPAENNAPIRESRKDSKKARPTLLSFAAPDYGIMFRCRVVCAPADAVSAAALTGLRFLEVSLKKANIERVTLVCDSPTYYFQATGQAKVARRSKDKREMMQVYRKKYRLEFRLVEPSQNPARHNCHGMAKTPSDVESPLTYNPLKWPQKGKMMPLQNGIEL